MEIVRARAYVRAWPAGPGEDVGRAALVGVAETRGAVVEETVLGYALMDAGEGRVLAATGWRGAVEETAAWCGVDAMLRDQCWPRPTDAMDGGGMVLRATRLAPETPGARVHILLALLATDAMADQTMVDLHGDQAGALHMSAPRSARRLRTMGQTMDQILRRPIWGWGRGRWCPRSSMRLDVIDECMRLEAARAGGPADAEEVARLEAGIAGQALHGARDDDYARFRAEWHRRHGTADWHARVTPRTERRDARRARDIILAQRAA